MYWFICLNYRPEDIDFSKIQKSNRALAKVFDESLFIFFYRIKYVRGVFQDMEKDLILLGATGVEDKLQDQVAETLNKLQKAGITTWMLTGDKKETAINMAHASGMVKSTQKQIDLCEVLDKKSLFTLVKEIHENHANNWTHPGSYLILDGKAISAILKSYDCRTRLSDILNRCDSIIACRLSPVQKSQLVTMVKDSDSLNITCAVGDGGNDVSMIQEAHVGLGLIGREGSAASQSADFAITKFGHLQKLMLVHGHWFYTRHSFLVQYSFYKQVACFLPQLYFAFYSNYSGSTLYDSWFLLMFNTLYTLVPAIIYGLCEQKYPSEYLLAHPELYKNNRHNSLMGASRFVRWFLLGVWHSVCIFFAWNYMWPICELLAPFGHGLPSLGVMVAGTAVTVVNLKILLEARYWSWPLILTVFMSICLYIVVTLIYNAIPLFSSPVFPSNFNEYFTYVSFFSQPILINVAITLLIVVAALLPDCLLIVHETIKEKLQRVKKVLPD